jgi:hypothetical protein
MCRLSMQKIGGGTAMNTMPAIGRYTSFDRGNTIQSTSVTIKIMSTSANLSGSAGKSAKGTGAGITTAGAGTGMARTNVTTGMTGMATTTIDVERSVRHSGPALLIGWSLLLAPYMVAADQPRESAIRTHARSFGAAVKRDTKMLGEDCKEGAHRVAIAAKAMGHEMATAAKRAAAESRAAFGGERVSTPSSWPELRVSSHDTPRHHRNRYRKKP